MIEGANNSTWHIECRTCKKIYLPYQKAYWLKQSFILLWMGKILITMNAIFGTICNIWGFKTNEERERKNCEKVGGRRKVARWVAEDERQRRCVNEEDGTLFI